mmetsp:Transcript_39369/g.105627  ORF Transcript_39369/g.105627 Transcript_39369/m.105627 type:complete len:370 (-) Transcript_39369:25-1134(-)
MQTITLPRATALPEDGCTVCHSLWSHGAGRSAQQELTALAEALPASRGRHALRGSCQERHHALRGDLPAHGKGRHLRMDPVVSGTRQALGLQGVLHRGVHAPDARGLLGRPAPGLEQRDHLALSAHDPLLHDGPGGQPGLHVAGCPRRVQQGLWEQLGEGASRPEPRPWVGRGGGSGRLRAAERIREHPGVRVALRVGAVSYSPSGCRHCGHGGAEGRARTATGGRRYCAAQRILERPSVGVALRVRVVHYSTGGGGSQRAAERILEHPSVRVALRASVVQRSLRGGESHGAAESILEYPGVRIALRVGAVCYYDPLGCRQCGRGGGEGRARTARGGKSAGTHSQGQGESLADQSALRRHAQGKWVQKG